MEKKQLSYNIALVVLIFAVIASIGIGRIRKSNYDQNTVTGDDISFAISSTANEISNIIGGVTSAGTSLISAIIKIAFSIIRAIIKLAVYATVLSVVLALLGIKWAYKLMPWTYIGKNKKKRFSSDANIAQSADEAAEPEVKTVIITNASGKKPENEE